MRCVLTTVLVLYTFKYISSFSEGSASNNNMWLFLFLCSWRSLWTKRIGKCYGSEVWHMCVPFRFAYILFLLVFCCIVLKESRQHQIVLKESIHIFGYGWFATGDFFLSSNMPMDFCCIESNGLWLYFMYERGGKSKRKLLLTIMAFHVCKIVSLWLIQKLWKVGTTAHSFLIFTVYLLCDCC